MLQVVNIFRNGERGKPEKVGMIRVSVDKDKILVNATDAMRIYFDYMDDARVFSELLDHGIDGISMPKDGEPDMLRSVYVPESRVEDAVRELMMDNIRAQNDGVLSAENATESIRFSKYVAETVVGSAKHAYKMELLRKKESESDELPDAMDAALKDSPPTNGGDACGLQ